VELEYPRVACAALCDFFELLVVEVTAGELLLCSGLELPLFSSLGEVDEGGVGGKPKSKKKIFFINF
jgi:hypothetical protein